MNIKFKPLTSPLLLAALLLLLSTNSFAQKKDLLFSFCNFVMPADLSQKSISFNEHFSFIIEESGKPAKIKRLLGEYLSEERVRQCLDNWRFSGFPDGTRASVLFTWKHGIGWLSTQVSSKGFYRKASDHNSR